MRATIPAPRFRLAAIMGPMKKVALVLGSGGARGYAHIGAIQILNERGYEVSALSGTSIGALIGGLHATGTLGEYTDWVTNLSPRDVRKLLDPVLPPGPGLMRLDRVLAHMSELLDGALIEDLPIPYTAVATDIGARREVWFTSGPLEAAIRASISIPGVITPVMVNGRLLVDGGVLNPLPMEPVIGADADFTLAVNLAGPKDHSALTPAKESAEQRPANEWLDRFLKSASGVWENDFVASMMARFSKGEDTEPQRPFDPPPPGLSLTDVTSMSLDTMSALVTRFRLAALPPDVEVTVPADAAKLMDFHRADELIELGRNLTIQALDDAFGPNRDDSAELDPASPMPQLNP